MRTVSGILAGLVLAATTALAMAAAPTYKNGVVTCPDGSKGKLSVPPFTTPAASQLSGVCLSLQAHRSLRPQPLTQPPMGQHPMSRDEINRQAGGLIGTPK